MTRYSRLLTWGIALTLVARPLVAQDARLVDRFPAPVLSRLTAVIDSTAHEGLPTEPLILRALEGSAKGATPDLIVAALTRLHAALRTARTTIGERAGVTELTTAASALEAGVPTARLMQLHQLRAGQPLTAPLAAYLDLIARGAAPIAPGTASPTSQSIAPPTPPTASSPPPTSITTRPRAPAATRPSRPNSATPGRCRPAAAPVGSINSPVAPSPPSAVRCASVSAPSICGTTAPPPPTPALAPPAP